MVEAMTEAITEKEQEQEQEQGKEQEDTTVLTETAPLVVASTLSKSWSIVAAHVPTFSGGLIAICRTPGLLQTKTTTTIVEEEEEEEVRQERKPFLLLPIHGDLAIVDAQKGTQIKTIRQNNPNNSNSNNDDNDVDDDDIFEEGIDNDAIVSYALSWNDTTLITCSRNQLLRSYDLTQQINFNNNTTNNNNNNSTNADPVDTTTITTTPDIVSLGRSGHTLPVTRMVFHPSNSFLATGSIDGTVRIWDVRNIVALQNNHNQNYYNGGTSGAYITHVFRPYQQQEQEDNGRRAGVTSLQWKETTKELILAIAREDGSITIHDLRYDEKQTTTTPNTNNNSGLPPVIMRDHDSAVTSMNWILTKNQHQKNNINDNTQQMIISDEMEDDEEDDDNNNQTVQLFVSTGRDSVMNTWQIIPHTTKTPPSSNARNKQLKNKHKHKRIETVLYHQYKRIHTIPMYEQIESMIVLPHYFHYSKDETDDSHHTDDSISVAVATAGSKGVVKLWQMTMAMPTTKTTSSESASSSIGKFKCVAEQPEPFGETKGGYLDMKFTPRSYSAVIQQQNENNNNSKFFGQTGQLVVADAEHNLLFLSLKHDTTLLSKQGTNKKKSKTLHTKKQQQQQLLRNERTIVGNNDDILDLKLLPSSQQEKHNKKAVVATNSAQVRVFDLETFSCDILDGHTATVLCVDASPCGRFIATCGKDKTMRIWSSSTSKNDDITANKSRSPLLAVATGHTEAIGATSLSRKVGRYDVVGKAADNSGGAFVVTASKDRTLKRWNLPGARILLAEQNDDGEFEPIALKTCFSARAHEKDINIVSVAPNDSLIATGSQDKMIKLWKATDLSLQATLKGHKRGVWDCQFSPYDRVLASCSGDKTIKLWSLGDYSCVRTFQGHLASALRVRFLSGGLQLVSSGADGLVKLWTIRSNECEATMDGHHDKVWAMDLSADGTQLVSGGADSQIVVWNDTTQEEEDEKRASREQNILLEQRLANHLRFKEFEQALELALDLQKPMHVLKVLNALVENDMKKGKSGLTTLQDHAKKWNDDNLVQIMRYCRDWNTRAKNSHIAMLVVQAVVTSIPVHTLASVSGLPEILAGITPYAERHFERLDRLQSSSYLVDFVLGAMGSLDDGIADEFTAWEKSSKLVLPPRDIDGRIQIGGTTLLGSSRRKGRQGDDDNDNTDDEIVTIGESDDSDDNSSDEEMGETE